MRNNGKRRVSLLSYRLSAMGITLAIFLGVFSPASAWHDGYESYEVGKPLAGQGGWKGTNAVVVDSIAHSGKKCVQVTPPAGDDGYIAVMSRVLDAMAGQGECWVDAWVRTPKMPWLVMTELQREGRMMSAAGLGLGEGREQFKGGYLLRTGRRSMTTWPRLYARKENPYTGESYQVKPETWVWLTARLDLKTKEFEVYQDGKCVFSELEMAGNLPESGTLSLVITTMAVKEGMDGYVFYVDDCYLGREKPAGIQKVELYPPRPEEAVLRFAVVGDTQIITSEVEKKNTIFSTFGTIIPCLNRLQPDLVLFVGDLVNIGGDVKDNPDLFKQQAQTLYPLWLEGIKKLQAPYYTVPGNHDPHSFYQRYIRRDINYSFATGGVTFIAFNSSHPSDPHGWEYMGKVTADQLAWMEKEMQKAVQKKNKIITFTHITSHENSHPLCGWYIKEGGEALRSLYDKYKVFAELSGHQHRWLASWKEKDTHYIIVPEVNWSGGGNCGTHHGVGVMVYDVFPEKIRQYEKPTKMPYLKDWGAWAQHELKQ